MNRPYNNMHPERRTTSGSSNNPVFTPVRGSMEEKLKLLSAMESCDENVQKNRRQTVKEES